MENQMTFTNLKNGLSVIETEKLKKLLSNETYHHTLNGLTYPVEAEDIIDSVPQVKDAIFAVYNNGFIQGIKEGQRIALKAIDKSFEESK